MDQESCKNHDTYFKAYREYFDKIDMKLYISGHMHLYQRTKPICYNGTVLPESLTHDMSCPIYVIEGAGGNDAYLQMDYDCKCNLIQIQSRIIVSRSYLIVDLALLLSNLNRNTHTPILLCFNIFLPRAAKPLIIFKWLMQ